MVFDPSQIKKAKKLIFSTDSGYVLQTSFEGLSAEISNICTALKLMDKNSLKLNWKNGTRCHTLSDSSRYAGPLFHLFTGYTLIGAFLLAAEDASSPVNFFPMLICGMVAGVLTVLIRNIGAFVDGVVFAVLIMNVVNPLIDKIKPKALGKGIEHA